MSVIAGIDFNTRAVDVVLLDEDTDRADWHRFDLDFLPGTDSFDRARLVKSSMPPSGFWDDTVAVGIEDPRGHGAGHLYRIQGGILQCLPPLVLVHPWIPSAWRKAVGLPGNCSKDAIVDYVHAAALPPGISWSSDACDALCIALATRDAVERTEAAA